MSDKKIALFQGKQICRHWDNDKELWHFLVVDVVGVLTGSTIPRRYWSDLKIKLQKEGSEVYEKIVQLKMQASAKSQMRRGPLRRSFSEASLS
jgi:hypothetical protein